MAFLINETSYNKLSRSQAAPSLLLLRHTHFIIPIKTPGGSQIAQASQAVDAAVTTADIFAAAVSQAVCQSSTDIIQPIVAHPT